MFSWFGGQPSQAKKDAPKKAILELRTQLDMLNKREKYLEAQIEEQQSIAKANVSKNKAMATTALKRKKAHETSLQQTSNQINMLENQIYTIEAANINQETVKAMRNANTAMQTINKGLRIEDVEQIMYVPTLRRCSSGTPKWLCLLTSNPTIGMMRRTKENSSTRLAIACQKLARQMWMRKTLRKSSRTSSRRTLMSRCSSLGPSHTCQSVQQQSVSPHYSLTIAIRC